MPSFHGNTKLNPGPRKNEPMMTSTAHNMMKIVKIEIANFRSLGLFDGFLSTNGASAIRPSPTPGMVTPATIGWNIVRSSCSPRKYHGAFDGFGVRLKSARPSSGARTTAEKIVRPAVMIRIDANSTTTRCGHVWTLSAASAGGGGSGPGLTPVGSGWG